MQFYARGRDARQAFRQGKRAFFRRAKSYFEVTFSAVFTVKNANAG